jgi:hypothetical protein
MSARKQIFISHSQHDQDLLDQLNRVFGNSNISQYKASFEDQEEPVSESLRNEIRKSQAMFVVLGPHAQKREHTKIWIGWEAGIAAQLGKPIWILEDVNTQVQMPIPSFSDYILWDSTDSSQHRNLRDLMESEFGLRDATDENRVRVHSSDHDQHRNVNIEEDSEVILQPTRLTCPYGTCGEHFRIWFEVPERFNCPSCKQVIKIA